MWDLTSKSANAIYTAWSNTVRVMWNVPHDTHRRFIEPLGGRHGACRIALNFASFVKFVSSCNKFPAIYLLHKCLNDKRTVTAHNIGHVNKMCKIKRRQPVLALTWNLNQLK